MDLIKKYLLTLLDQLEKGEKTPEQVSQLSTQINEALVALENGDQSIASDLINNIGLKA